MKKISGILFFICMLMLGGILDGINEGAPLSTALWCIPLFLLMWVSGRMADKTEEEENT